MDEKDTYILIGTCNSMKVEAVREAFGLCFFSYDNCSFYPLKVSSDVNEQPIGFEETHKGAMNRMNNAIVAFEKQINKKHKLNDKEEDISLKKGEQILAVAIENGLFEMSSDLWVDIGVVVICRLEVKEQTYSKHDEDNNDDDIYNYKLKRTRVYMSTSTGTPFPNTAVEEAKRRGWHKVTAGSVLNEWYGWEGGDPHKSLTGGYITRKEMLIQAIVASLGQLLRGELPIQEKKEGNREKKKKEEIKNEKEEIESYNKEDGRGQKRSRE